MNATSVDKLVLDDDWSDLTRFQEMPQIDLERMSRYRMARLKQLEEMSLDTSPLTRLPGGISIERNMQERIASGEPTAFCLVDIDNFKIYNDYYG